MAVDAVTLSTAAAVVGAASAQRTSEIARCSRVVQAFDASTASLEEKQQYAHCITWLFPAGDPMTLKITIVFTFLGLGAGVVKGVIETRRAQRDTTWSQPLLPDLGDWVAFIGVGGTFGFAAGLAIAAFVAAVSGLIS